MSYEVDREFKEKLLKLLKEDWEVRRKLAEITREEIEKQERSLGISR